jgi:hypothetical protein
MKRWGSRQAAPEKRKMPEYIRLDRIENPGDDEWLAAVARDYEVPQNPSIFVARGPNDERIAFWIGPDGGGFGAVDGDPEGYIQLSQHFAGLNPDYTGHHRGVEEYEFDPGTFDPDDSFIEEDFYSNLF